MRANQDVEVLNIEDYNDEEDDMAWKMMPRHRGRLIEAFGTFPAAAPRDPCITQALEEEVLLREHP